jgi:Tfp pilus assembly protein PilN
VIEINLLPSSTGRRNARGGSGKTFGLPKLPAIGADPWYLGLGAAAALVLVFGGWSFWSTSGATTRLQAQIEQEVTDSTRYATTIALVTALTERQDTIRQKIEVIRSVDTRRFVWPRILDEISRSLPAFTWVTSLSSSDGPEVPGGPAITLEGAAGSTQALTRFMKNLEASPVLRDVTLVTTEQVNSEGRAFNRFTLEARYELPDSAFIETVPVIVLTN